MAFKLAKFLESQGERPESWCSSWRPRQALCLNLYYHWCREKSSSHCCGRFWKSAYVTNMAGGRLHWKCFTKVVLSAWVSIHSFLIGNIWRGTTAIPCIINDDEWCIMWLEKAAYTCPYRWDTKAVTSHLRIHHVRWVWVCSVVKMRAHTIPIQVQTWAKRVDA